MRSRLLAVLAAAGAALPVPACPGNSHDRPDAGSVDVQPDSGAGAAPDASSAIPPDAGTPYIFPGYRTRLETPADIAALAAADDGEIKYLAPVASKERTAPLLADCYFQDMHLYPWHIQFLHGFPELASMDLNSYVSLVLKRATRTLWGGSVKAWPAVTHPVTHQPGIVAYTIYAETNPADALVEDDIVEVDARLKSCAPMAASILAFVPSDQAQMILLQTARPSLAARGVASVFPSDLIAGLPSVTYSEGEGYGLLRLVRAGQPLTDYGPREVVVVESAPNDISIVSGLVTANPQNELSHVNLRLREKGIPNAAVPDIYANAFVTALAGSLVHLEVTASQVIIEPARLEDAEAFWSVQRPPLGAAPADLTVQALGTFAEFSHADALSVGVKAANLAEIYKALPAGNTQPGFAIPFSKYVAFVQANGLSTVIQETLADPRLRTDAAYKTAALKSLRDQIKEAPLPPGLLDEIAAQIRAVFGGTGDADTLFVRLRSSTNAEDLEDFSGAGLYDSRTGCLADDLDGDTAGPSRCLTSEHAQYLQAKVAARQAELAEHPERTWLPAIIAEHQEDLVKEKTIAKALRGVWASLWNERAFDEREYYGIDHLTVYMAEAVNPAFVMEKANAVAVTHLLVDAGDPLYRVVSQAGEESVVRPADPLAVAEVVTFRRAAGTPPTLADIQLLVPSSLVPAGTQVWPSDAQQTLGGLLFTLHDYFAANVYPDRVPLHLDVEIKWTRDGRVVVKQARPYWTMDP